jgi:hypothetical protein
LYLIFWLLIYFFFFFSLVRLYLWLQNMYFLFHAKIIGIFNLWEAKKGKTLEKMIMGGVRLSFFRVCVKNNGQLSIAIWFCSLNSRWAEFKGNLWWVGFLCMQLAWKLRLRFLVVVSCMHTRGMWRVLARARSAEAETWVFFFVFSFFVIAYVDVQSWKGTV